MTEDNFQEATKGLIYSQGKYLLLIRSKTDENYSLLWDLPGGKVKKGESLTEGLKREVEEETSIIIDITKAKIVKKWIFEKNGMLTNGTDFFFALSDQPEVKLSFEHSDFYWFTEKEIMENEQIPYWIKDTLKLSINN
jgi:8-oxo-dGTP diphosphatase